MKNKTQAVKQPAKTVEEVIARLRRESGPEGGSIFLADLCAEIPQIPKAEVIQALRNSNAGAFVVGRRGAASRWVYGNMAKNLPQAQPSSSPTNQGGRKQYTRRATGTPTLEVRVTMGNRTLVEESVPLNFQLQPV